MTHPLVEYFRCPEVLAVLESAGDLPPEEGYFRFGEAVCYGRQSVGSPSARPGGNLVDVSSAVSGSNGSVMLPFELDRVVDTLRHELYPEALAAIEHISTFNPSHALYYTLRPVLPVSVRKRLQRLHWKGWEDILFPRWPVDTTVETLMKQSVAVLLESCRIAEFPFIWFWPGGAPACVMMTHDVEGTAGGEFCPRLMEIDDEHGIRSSFQLIPDGPRISRELTRRLVDGIKARGFEVNVHDLTHDGHLFRNREKFLRHASAINARGREFGSRGFRSGAMYRRQAWFASLDISYDMSVPNVAHLEPQAGGCCTVLPYFTGHVLELPLTASQDYTVFHVLGERSTRLWREQIDIILAENGLLSFIAHPDYLIEPSARQLYLELLRLLVSLRETRGVWTALPSEIDQWWRNRRSMRLVADGPSWRIQGPGSDRARLAYARLRDGRLVYELAEPRAAVGAPGLQPRGQVVSNGAPGL